MEKQIKELRDNPPKRGGGNSDRELALRDSLTESGPMIRREYNRDFARFGDKFAIGDCKCGVLQD